MARKYSSVAPEWWDYTTLEPDLIEAAAKLTPEEILQLSRPGFKVVFYDSLEDFYLAEALEYVAAWTQSTDDNPVGVCGPIGPTEHLPLVARIVNALELKLHSAHFWGMDECSFNSSALTIRATRGRCSVGPMGPQTPTGLSSELCVQAATYSSASAR